MQVMAFTLITSYLCGAWNIAGGYGGLFSFGHAAFIGVGAYTTTILLLYYGIPGWIGMILGGLLSACLGWLLSWTICRFHIKGFYFAIGSMLVAEILMSIVVRTRYLGRGMGITFPAINKPFNFQFVGIMPYYYLALVFVCLIIIVAYLIERSRLGWYLRATRQSEEASAALGINVTRMKVVSMTLSAFLTGLGGGIYVLTLRFCSPYDVFGIMFSVALMLG
jgi:branched-chain amino acid transport system permease protein